MEEFSCSISPMKEVEKIWAKREVDEVSDKIYNFQDIMDKHNHG
jgi:hypothetical protein